jgi:molybdopterin-binding protein
MVEFWKASNPAAVSVPPIKETQMKLSARNQLRGTVTGITRGQAIANVELDASGQRVVSSITVEAVDELALSEGSEVIAVVKASDVILATD